MATFVKCNCQHCGKHIEFDKDAMEASGGSGADILGNTVPCPHCGMDTILVLPKPAFKPSPKPAAPQRAPQHESPAKKLRASTAYSGGRTILTVFTILSWVGAIISYALLGNGEIDFVTAVWVTISAMSMSLVFSLGNALLDIADKTIQSK